MMAHLKIWIRVLLHLLSIKRLFAGIILCMNNVLHEQCLNGKFTITEIQSGLRSLAVVSIADGKA